MNWKTPVIIVLVVLAAFVVLYPFLPVEEAEVDATYSGVYWPEGAKDEGVIYQEITVHNIGDSTFRIEASEWNIVCDGYQYTPNILRSILYGYSEVDLEPGNKHTFTLVYDVRDDAGKNGCRFLYVGDKNVEYRAE